MATFANPQVLLAPGVTDQIQKGFAALGPNGAALFQQLMTAIRGSLATAIVNLFLVGAGVLVLGLIATVFLPEIPLRKGNYAPEVERVQGDLAEIGLEIVPNVRQEAVQHMCPGEGGNEEREVA